MLKLNALLDSGKESISYGAEASWPFSFPEVGSQSPHCRCLGRLQCQRYSIRANRQGRHIGILLFRRSRTVSATLTKLPWKTNALEDNSRIGKRVSQTCLL